MKKIIFLLVIVLFAIGCGKKSDVKAESDGKISNFSLEDLNGNKYESSKIINNGKKTLFVVAAEWCPHCRAEAPDIQKFYDEYKDKVNVIVVYSEANSSLDKVKEYVKNNEYTFPIYYDSGSEILTGFKVQAFPFNLIMDGNKIVKEHKGELTYDLLVEEFGK